MNRLAITSCVAIGTAGVLAAAMSGAHANPKSSTIWTERDLVVTLVTPTLNQEVLADLSDPGLNRVITVRFSSILKARDLIDNQNTVNRLSANAEFLDATFARLPGTPSVRRNVFTFAPLSLTTPVLTPGQYMLNLKSSIRNTRGRLLNNGVDDYTTTFSVLTDVYPPVLRRISPIDGQTNIGLLQSVTATFNEPLNFSTLASTVIVQDASTNPPSLIPGILFLARQGFDLVFKPDPCFGYPPRTNIQFLVQGYNAIGATKVTNTVEDMFKNKFQRDPTLRWQLDPTIANLWHSPLGTYNETTGQFRLQFQTKGVTPPPAGLRPGGPHLAYGPPYASPCRILLWEAPSCEVAGNSVQFSTGTGFGEMDLRAYITRFNQGVTDFTLISILPNSPVRVGRPAGAILDPRVIGKGLPLAMHTFMYVVDERSGTVAVMRSDNFKILGRLSGFSDPRDVGISDNTAGSSITLYVSSYGANQLVGVDLQGIAVAFNGQPGAPSPCAAIKDNSKGRVIVQVGTGPTEVAADCYLHQRIMVANTLEGSVSLLDARTNKVLKTHEVGGNPVSCDWNTIQFGGIRVALVANQGGLADPNGSISLYINSPPLSGGFLGAGQVRDGIESTMTDGVKNPTHIWGNQKWIDPPPPAGTLTSFPIFWYASNTGGTTALDLRLNISGLFGLSITPSVANTIVTGLNPTSTVPDAFYPNALAFSSVVGTGSMTAVDPARAVPAVAIPVPGIRRLFTESTN